MRLEGSLNQQLLKLIQHRPSAISSPNQLRTQILIWQQFHRNALDYYHQQIKTCSSKNKEINMHNSNLIKFLLDDILISGEYTIKGVSAYTHIPEELLMDIIVGYNQNPSFEVSTKILYLHTTVRRSLYKDFSIQYM